MSCMFSNQKSDSRARKRNTLNTLHIIQKIKKIEKTISSDIEKTTLLYSNKGCKTNSILLVQSNYGQDIKKAKLYSMAKLFCI